MTYKKHIERNLHSFYSSRINDNSIPILKSISKYILMSFSFLLFIPSIQSQTTFWSEDFETDGTGTRYTADLQFIREAANDVVSRDYFGRIDNSTGTSTTVGCLPLPLDLEVEPLFYIGQNGNFFFGGEDLDQTTFDCGNSINQDDRDIIFEDININGASEMTLKFLFAVGSLTTCNTTKARWDDGDGMEVFYSKDGGAEQKVYCIRTQCAGNDEPLASDPNCDGNTSDGVLITHVFQEFLVTIPSGGSLMDLRFNIHANEGGQAWAIDFIRLESVTHPIAADPEPTVETTVVTGSNTNTVKDGESVVITVTFSEDVTTTGATATIPLTVDAVSRVANLQAAQADVTSSTLIFEYYVQEGENGAVAVSDTDVITITSGTIQDATGNDLTGDLGIVSGTVTVDTAPIASTTVVTGSNTDTVKDGESVVITVTFSEDVTTTGATATIPLTVDAVSRVANLQAAQSDVTSSTLIFEYYVQAGENGAVAVSDTDVITITSGTIQDATGNDLTGDLGIVSGTVTVDTAPIASTTVVTGSNTDTVKDGESVVITVTFSEDVTTTGATATIPLTVDAVSRVANLQAAQSDVTSSTLIFEYYAQAGENGAVAVSDTDVITITSGTIQDATANDLSGDLGSISGTVTVDTDPVAVTSVISGSDTDVVTNGESVLITVTFSEAVTATVAEATVIFTIGAVAKTATLQGQPLTSTGSSVVFEYAAQAGDNGAVAVTDTDVITITAGTIQDATGNNLTGDLGTVSGTVTVEVIAFTTLADLCLNDGNQTGLSGGTPTGGVYSGDGVMDDGNGMTYSFNPVTAGVGVTTITYTQGGNSAMDDVEVFAVPTVAYTAPADLCLDDGAQNNLGGGTPTGGVYSGDGVTDDGNGMTYNFDPVGAGVGTHTLTYTVSVSGCSGSATDDVAVAATCSCDTGNNIYTGTDGDWENPDNWSLGCYPSSPYTGDITINSGTLDNTGLGDFIVNGNVVIGAAAVFTIVNGNTLTVNGDFTNNGTTNW